MSNYNYMNKKGLKAMRMNALVWITIFTIALIVFTIFNVLKFHWIDNRTLIIAEIVGVVIFVVFFFFLIPKIRYKKFS